MPVKRVAVIGAGVAGLMSVKSCLEAGLEPVCFERNDQIGGVWLTPELTSWEGVRGGTVYQCLMTNSSKEMTAISDFPFPREYPPYLTPRHLLAYYRDFASHFKLDRHIRLAAEVTKVAPSEDHETTGQWEVWSQPRRRGDSAEHATTSEVFDAVIVATGMYNTAVVPNYPGQGEFTGEILHSNRFRSGEQFAGKTVLVVGGSHSAGDVAVDASRYAKQVYLSMRDGAWVIGRFGPGGMPTDAFGNHRWKSMVPEAIRRRMAKPLFEGHFDPDNLGLRCKRQLFDGYMMVNDEIQCRIICGALKCKPGVEHFTSGGVVFEDGTRVDGLDAVVFATGYELSFPFFEDNSIIADNFADLELYMHVWPARRAHPTMAAVGVVSALGAQTPLFELQSRWVVQVFLGNAQLPSIDERLEDVKRRKDAAFQKFGRHRIFCYPVPYCEEVAAKFGARPNFIKLLLTDPRLALRTFFGPAYPPTYRLNGPHPWKGARDAIMNGWANTVNPTRTRTVAKPAAGGALSTAIVVAVLLIGFVFVFS
ncbi:dimethylaniline monooxygenase [N-oxide-forming] 5-like [Acanthaster planci]|uniref:Flavin-containing monooxygenase n=1 Tax=Acanthaster planci TaxID=133434 RepID=A0A8B7ZHG7_ACAPL|nr:dimethylaniline monooxygenase [N-oxide-forming] 5-like [Acanthaster planci]